MIGVVPACSQLSRLLDEPLAGTAPVARSWLLVEQPGPWGRKALTQSHIDPVLGAALETAANAHGARAALVRRPGRHPDIPSESCRRVWIAHTSPQNVWLLGGTVEHVAQLGEVSWPGVERGDLELVHDSLPSLLPETDPLLLVCTNGRRDVCCANYGRPVVTRLHSRFRDRTWETTHLGGHRFAPTAAVLPHGVVYGRMDVESTAHVVEQARAGRHVLVGYRGRSTFDRPAQVAEAAVRQATGIDGIDDLDVASMVRCGDEVWQVAVTGPNGRCWTVGMRARRLDPARAESCGGPPVQPVAYLADAVVEE